MDNDREELLERRLSQKVTERVEKQIKRRYGFVVAVAIAVAAYFGWSISNELTEISKRLSTASDELKKIELNLDPLKSQLADLEKQAEDLSARNVNIRIQTQELQSKIEAERKAQDDYVRRQSEIIVRNIGETLNLRDVGSAGFFEDMRKIASEKQYNRLEAFLLVKLGQNRAYIGDEVGARYYFDRAEEKARAISRELYLNVLVDRAQSEADNAQENAALITLQRRALEAVMPEDHANLGRIFTEIANTHHQFDQYELSANAYREAAAHFETADQLNKSAEIYRTIGDILSDSEANQALDVEGAIEAYGRSIELADYEDDYVTLHYAHESLANIYEESGNATKQQVHICESALAAGHVTYLREKTDVVRRLTKDSSQTYEGYCQ